MVNIKFLIEKLVFKNIIGVQNDEIFRFLQ